MKEKFISAIMAGAYVAFGAITYLVIPNALVGAMFFSTGIFLVFNFNRLLFTKVVPMSVVTKEFNARDIAVTWCGNFIGALFVALLTRFSRINTYTAESLKKVAEKKLHDTPISLFIMGMFCAIFVGYAVFLGKKYKEGTLPHIFFVWLLITAFVYGGYDHIVANFYYLSAYTLNHGFEVASLIKAIVCVTAGNVAGGLFVGALEKRVLLPMLPHNVSH